VKSPVREYCTPGSVGGHPGDRVSYPDFRELNNKEASHAMALKYCAGKRLRLENLMTGEVSEVMADREGNVVFAMGKGGDYRFYKYAVID